VAAPFAAFGANAPAPTPLPQNPAAPGQPTADDDSPTVVKLPDADLDLVLRTLESYTGKAILRPTQLPTTTYNINIPNPVPRSAAVRYIETVLALNGIAVIPLDENVSKVVATPQARAEAPMMITGSALDVPPSGRVALKFFQLEFLRVTDFLPMLTGILNGTYGPPIAVANANAVVITDSVSNLQRVEVILKEVDRPIAGNMKPKFYELKNGAKASDVVTKLRGILQTMVPQLGTVTSYSADDRTNQLILITDPRQHAFFDELIERLDQKSDPFTRNEVIHLNHANAEKVVQVIGNIISKQSTALRQSQSTRPGQGLQGVNQPGVGPGGPGTPPGPVAPIVTPPNPLGSVLDSMGTTEFSSIVSVVNDERTNAVVVSGTFDDIRLLRELITKLDIVLAQVRIEVVIAEVTLDNNNQTGISALGLKVEGDRVVGFSLDGGDSSGIAITNGIISRPGWSLAADLAITSTPRKTNAAIISQPAIVTSHGKKSFVFSGEQRPVVTGSITSGTAGGTTSTTQQQRIGTRLEVTPYIGVDGSVQLELKQTVEDVTGQVIIDGNPIPVVGTRETESYITAKSGETYWVGGFQKKIDSKSTSRIGPIPIIGDIFGARQKGSYRQELIFFIRPVVMTNQPQVDNAEAYQRVEKLPTKEKIKEALDPNYQSPPKSIIDRILPN
jgi:general secretion pathway protein D